MILSGDEERGEYQFHFLYTTSYHGPFKIPLEKYGYDTERVMPDAPEDIKTARVCKRISGPSGSQTRRLESSCAP